MFRLLLALALSGLACGAKAVAPSRFYIVSDFFSDHGGVFYYRVVDVSEEGQDTLVRYVRIAISNLSCPRRTVQAVEAKLPGKRPADLARNNNPCAVQPGILNTAAKKYLRQGGHLEAISFAIVAQCGGTSLVLELPHDDGNNLAKLKAASPQLAHLWDLAGEIEDRVFGKNDVFHDRSDADEQELQRVGQTIVPELMSGRYDAGLAAAVRGLDNDWKSPSFRKLLADYHGPVSAAAMKAGYIPELQNIDGQALQFQQYKPPSYPPLAVAARVMGVVELELSVRAATGEVVDAVSVSGPPLLRQSAVDAAKGWHFVPGTLSSDTLRLAVNYSNNCPNGP